MKKNLFLAVALAGLAFGCKSTADESTEASVSTTPCATECADKSAECAAKCEAMKADCAAKQAECEKKVCPVTGQEIN